MKLLDGSLYAEELKLERESAQLGVEHYRKMVKSAIERGAGASLRPAERILVHWFELYRAAIRKEQAAIKAGKSGVGRRVYGALLCAMSADKAAVLAMYVTVGMLLKEAGKVRVSRLAYHIGLAFCADLYWKPIQKDTEAWQILTHLYRRPCERTPKFIVKAYRKRWPSETYSMRVRAHTGACLLRLLIETATWPGKDGNPHPAFTLFQERQSYKWLKVSDEILHAIGAEHLARQSLRPRYQPMVCKPPPWSDEARGGYLHHQIGLIKHIFREPAKIPDAVYAAVNALNSTSWRVNRRVLAVMQTLAEQGGNVAGIPRMRDLLNPPKPADIDTNIEMRKAWRHQVALNIRADVIELPQRICFGLTLDLAKRFARYERFYFPHQLDFRGRAYPVPIFLHYQADDVSRGLLEFAEPRSAWGDAERWIKIHLANCCGVDKVSFADRIAWVDANRDQFSAWVDNPLDADSWMKQDNPFQCLAAAFALFDKDVAAHLPIQLDGSNNALQHYGAMLRCPETAKLANLIPSDKPADPYSEIANLLAKIVSKDAATDALAASLEGWINRKIVKQTVMTTYYGVTIVGARRQVREHLKKAGFAGENMYEASRYIGGQTLMATGKVCKAGHKAMRWLRECAREIARSNKPVQWKTPFGFHVTQPYRNPRQVKVQTILGDLFLNRQPDSMPMHVRKQIQGFPPNFIHSIDASHMMATAIACREAKITLAVVHDSYWTHAADMDRLGGIIRHEFVRLHERPLLEDLRAQLIEQYPKLKFKKPPKVGKFDINVVADSLYAFA